MLTEPFYWDLNDGTRAFSDRYAKQNGGKKPTAVQAGVYASVLHYLKAVEALKSASDGAKVVAKMKEIPTDDPLFGKGNIRRTAARSTTCTCSRSRSRRVEGSVGPLQDPGDDPRQRGVPTRSTRAIAATLDSKLALDARIAARLTLLPAAPLARRPNPNQARSTRESPDPMPTILGVPMQALFGQLLLGLINGSFYAILSLGLAIIFGLLNIINFTHGAQYMMGAFVAWMLLNYVGLGYWWALLLAPIIVGLFGVILERLLISRLYKLDHLYGLLLTFGLALIIQGLFRNEYGVSGLPYAIPSELSGGQRLPFMFLPNYRGWVVVASLVVCIATWLVIEKTKLGAYLRAATENRPWSRPSASTCPCC